MLATKGDTCDIYTFDEDKVKRVHSKMNEQSFSNIAQLFKALAETNRSKIVFALCEEEELCVCDLANIIGATVATTSHHLRTLYKQGVVKFRKEGKLAFYSLDDEHIKQLMEIAIEHTNEVRQSAES